MCDTSPFPSKGPIWKTWVTVFALGAECLWCEFSELFPKASAEMNQNCTGWKNVASCTRDISLFPFKYPSRKTWGTALTLAAECFWCEFPELFPNASAEMNQNFTEPKGLLSLVCDCLRFSSKVHLGKLKLLHSPWLLFLFCRVFLNYLQTHRRKWI